MDSNEWENNIILTSLEIAFVVLGGKLGEDAFESTLELLDISDVEADVLWDNLKRMLEDEGCGMRLPDIADISKKMEG